MKQLSIVVLREKLYMTKELQTIEQLYHAALILYIILLRLPINKTLVILTKERFVKWKKIISQNWKKNL